MDFLAIITFLTAISFLFYGTSCLTTAHMKKEFQRFGYPRQRLLTGYLQLLGALGLIIGYVFFAAPCFALCHRPYPYDDLWILRQTAHPRSSAGRLTGANFRYTQLLLEYTLRPHSVYWKLGGKNDD